MAERPSLLGADFISISGYFTTRLPEAISPRLLIGWRKTGYLDLSTGSGDCDHDICGCIGTHPVGPVYRTTSGLCRTTLQAKFLQYQNTIVSRNLLGNFLWNRYGIMYGIICDDSNGMDFLGKIVFLIYRTKYAKIIDLSCKLSCRSKIRFFLGNPFR